MYRYNYKIDEKAYKVGKYASVSLIIIFFVDIWDTAGQESFNELHPTYYFGAHACILVFDVNRKITYQNLRLWYAEMRN